MPEHEWTIDRLTSKTTPEPMTGCWLWTASVFKNGYGQAGRGTNQYAHRLAYRLARGLIPKGASVLHRCDQRSCVNPDHLFLGTPTENMLDMTVKGRRARGNTHGRRRLSAEQVRDIRAKLAAGAGQSALAREHGVTRLNIHLIAHNRTWAQ